MLTLEAFIVDNLARLDRGAVDEQDARRRVRETSRRVVSVLLQVGYLICSMS
jgi:hypothetical protein